MPPSTSVPVRSRSVPPSFYDFLRKNHPLFACEKDGRLVGKYQISDREEEFVEFGGGKAYE